MQISNQYIYQIAGLCSSSKYLVNNDEAINKAMIEENVDMDDQNKDVIQ